MNPSSESNELESGLRKFIKDVGEDADGEEFKDTPYRFVCAMREMTEGYQQNPELLIKTFDAGEYNQMVMLKDIPFSSTCAHHLLPFLGVAHVAYIANGRIIGLSKLARIVEMYARRLQVQERLTSQVADLLWTHLNPEGVGVAIEATHSCMTCRGVKKTGTMITQELRGSFLVDGMVRSEFLNAIR